MALFGASIGIDLGNCYSCVGIWEEEMGAVKIIPNAEGNLWTAAFVSFDEDELYFGDVAKYHSVVKPTTTIFNVLRLIGLRFNDPQVQDYKNRWPFRLEADEHNNIIIPVTFKGEPVRFRPEDILCLLFSHLRGIAEEYLQTEVKDAVIALPSLFNFAQHRSITEAASLAGLQVLDIMSPPVLAGHSFGMKFKSPEVNTLVFDFGGSACNVAVLVIEEGIFEVRAVASNCPLGGDNIDNRMVDYFLQKFQQQNKGIYVTPRAVQRLRIACERAKRTLSSEKVAKVEIETFLEGIDLSAEMTRVQFEDLNIDLFRQCLLPVEKAVSDSKLKKGEIKEIILVGGSSRIPKVQQLLSEFFDGKALNTSANPDCEAARGAALQAAIISGVKTTQLNDLLLMDVSLISLGIEGAGGMMTTIIKRNTTTPAKKTITISTTEDNQTSMTIKLYEGEESMAWRNTLLATLVLEGIPPMKKGKPEIDVTIDLAARGYCFTLSAKEKSTGRSAEITVSSQQSIRDTSPAQAIYQSYKQQQQLLALAHLGKTGSDEDYLQKALAMGKKEWGRGKIMIVGEGRAGKTALTNSILGRPYKELESTVGVNTFTCNVGYAGISTTVASETHCWQEMQQELVQRVYETTIARMILEQKKTIQPQSEGNKEMKDKISDIDESLQRRPDRGYIEDASIFTPDTSSSLETNFQSTVTTARSFTTAATTTTTTVIEEETFTSLPETSPPEKSPIKSNTDARGLYEAPKQSLPPPAATTTQADKAVLDSSLVMKFMGEQQIAESKFIMSVFDFGGQSVFNVIHPFFFTRYGIYIITFNMEWLQPGKASKEMKESCLDYLSFWLHSVIIHTQNEKGEVAPIFFVGTRKDLVSSPAQHEQISTLLYEKFSTSQAWPYVIEQEEGQGANGRTILCFFPIDNQRGSRDPALQSLLAQIEKVTDDMPYVHVERPLPWFQVVDAFRLVKEKQKQPFLSYSEVETIAEAHGIPRERCPVLLRFLHEMGVLMWHDEETLREIILLDPIDGFVTPATRIICKHTPNAKDGIFHSLDLHKTVKKRHPKDFQTMTKAGLVSETLLSALLQNYTEIQAYVKHLMIKYGLLVPLLLLPHSPELSEDAKVSSSSIAVEREALYLATALLPEKDHLPQSILEHTQTMSHHSPANCFAFVFAAASDDFSTRRGVLSLEQCHQQGFYPQGLFERLMAKAIAWSQATSDFLPAFVGEAGDSESGESEESGGGCYQGYADLSFGNQRFSMIIDSKHHLISVVVRTGNHPAAIHQRLKAQIEEIIAECWKSLKFFTVLVRPALDKGLQLLRLTTLRQVVEKRSALSLPSTSTLLLSSTLSYQEVLRVYSPWFLNDHHPLADYDLFLSYRWNRGDSELVNSLFERLSTHVVDPRQQRPIRVFLDSKRLPPGRDFQLQFVTSLQQSLLLVPIVSAEALQRLKTLTETDEDNVLIEWICGLTLIRSNNASNSSNTHSNSSVSRVVKILPIFIGSRGSDVITSSQSSAVGQNLFDEKLIEQLSDTIIPKRCLEVAKQLLLQASSSNNNNIINTAMAEMSTWSIQQIVKALSKYLFVCAWNYPNLPLLVKQVAEALTGIINEQLPLLVKGTSDSPPPTATPTTASSSTKSFAEMTLIELFAVIRREFGMTESLGYNEVITAVVENFSESEKQQCLACQGFKQKALKILEIAGL